MYALFFICVMFTNQVARTSHPSRISVREIYYYVFTGLLNIKVSSRARCSKKKTEGSQWIQKAKLELLSQNTHASLLKS